MIAILAFCPCCFLPLVLVHPPPPTFPLNIIPTLAPHVPAPFSESPVLPVCEPAFHICSDTVVRRRKGVLFIKSTGAGDYAWKPCLPSSISCRDLSKSLIFSGPPFPQFTGKKEPDWVIAPCAFIPLCQPLQGFPAITCGLTQSPWGECSVSSGFIPLEATEDEFTNYPALGKIFLAKESHSTAPGHGPLQHVAISKKIK